MLTKDEILGIFLSCDMLDKDGLYADDVDIYELCAAVEKAVAMKYARAERAECIKFGEITQHRGGPRL
jgi:hypothetical protein